ncbi:MAG: phosphohydrolase [Bacteroidetes bacterium]|nr:phosphohydrolase [Bacteroidota bacterium]MCL5027365.1 phosphohydrolase [Chloroflexota bacterium]
MQFNRICPGSSSIKNATPEYIICTNCGNELEIWTDELQVKCPKCGTQNCRDRAPSCIDWCAQAEACFGPEVYRRFKAARTPGS